MAGAKRKYRRMGRTGRVKRDETDKIYYGEEESSKKLDKDRVQKVDGDARISNLPGYIPTLEYISLQDICR